MADTMGQPGARRQEPAEAGSGRESAPPAVVNLYLRLWVYRMRAVLSFIGAACDPRQHYWPACSCSPRRLHRLTAAFSSFKTRRTVTASTNASPTAKNVARMPPGPIASRGISPRPRPIGASTPMKSPARFPSRARVAAIQAATNTSPLPANAEPRQSRQKPRAALPHRRPGNDVTLPREAGK
jgi:hypothetical protein